MKKLLFLPLLFLFTVPALSQEIDPEDNKLRLYRLDVSAGLYTSKDIYTSLQFDNSTPWGKNSTGSFFLSTSFYKRKKTEVGIALGYQKPNLDDRVYVNSTNGLSGRLDVEYYTIMPQVRFNWVTSEDDLFELYSVFGFALTFVDENYSNDAGEDGFFPIPGAHVTGLGIRFGDTFGGFMELGFGSKGMMSAGLSYRL